MSADRRPGPRAAPAVLAVLAALALLVAPGADPGTLDVSEAAIRLRVDAPEGDATWARLDVPAAVFGYLRHGTDDLRLVDADGRELPRIVRPSPRDPADRAAGRVALAPEVVVRGRVRDGLVLVFDLRVAAAPELRLALDVQGPVTGTLEADDVDGLEAQAGHPLPVLGQERSDTGAKGVVAVPAGSTARFVRVHVPTSDPDAIRVARADATIAAHRVWFRVAGARRPITLVAGLDGLPPPALLPDGTVSGWDDGAPASVAAPPWPRPFGSSARVPGGVPLPPGRPFPIAEVVATVLLLLLVIWASLLRREG